MKKTVTIPLEIAKHISEILYLRSFFAESEQLEEAIQAAENPSITLDTFAAGLERPLVFLDAETTGTNTAKDRIVSLAVKKLYPSGDISEMDWLINPGILIPAEASAIHNIYDGDVFDKPTFCQLQPEILDWLEDSDIAHFNGDKFDVPLLCEEFHRCGIQWPAKDTISVDVSNIFRKKEGRSLGDAVKFYLQEDLEGAHDAAADTKATMNVLLAQIKRYGLTTDIKELAAEFKFNPDAVDIAGKFIMKDGEPHYNFGKHNGKPVKSDPSYVDWMLGGDFTADTKRHGKMILESINYM